MSTINEAIKIDLENYRVTYYKCESLKIQLYLELPL